MRVLLVDDEAPIRLALGTLLRRAGYLVTIASSGEEAIERLQLDLVDILVSDLRLPGIDGLAVVRAAQERDPDIVCLILTGHGTLESAIGGLHQHIFDYVLKSGEPQTVLDRVAAAAQYRADLQRRKRMLHTLVSTVSELGEPGNAASMPGPAPSVPAASALPAEDLLVVGPLRIDLLHQQVTIDGRCATLTPMEIRVLYCLAQHAGTMLRYADLVRCARGDDACPEEVADLIKPHIHHLRQKLETDPAHPRYLLNVRGSGYVLFVEDNMAEQLAS